MESREAVGANIRARRTRRCWSQEHLALAAGVNVRTVQRAEEGKGISMETMLAVAAALDVSVGELQGERARASDRASEVVIAARSTPAPTGKVTLVFGDIQGATPLWEREPLTMRRAMMVHNAVLRRLTERHGGYAVRAEGDAFMVAFRDPVVAIEFCLAVQGELLDAEWPESLMRHPEAAEIKDPKGTVLFRGLRVRLAIHSGDVESESDPITGRVEYYGRVVSCGVRLVQVAHGGQVLASGTAWSLAEGRASAEAEDLGEVRLRGLITPVGLVQIHPRTGLRRSFPPPKCHGGKRTNLVPARTSFLGRAREIEQITSWFRGGKRLVTLLGPGGAGKTRLGRAAGAALVSEFAEGVWLVELAPVKTLESAADAVAEVLSIQLSDSVGSRVQAIGAALRTRGSILLILDNVEHLAMQLRGAVLRWLDQAPELRILVTSQHPLSIQGEQICPVLGLTQEEAVALFLARTQEVCPSVSVTQEGEVLVQELVERLERLPLAIELAAARMKVLSLPEIRDRLRSRFALLASASNDSLARHAALRATIEWSFSLLLPYEKAAVVDLARLPGSFDVATAEAVLDLSAFADAPPRLDVIQSLLEKSLLWASDSRDSAGEPRLRSYESVRAFALEYPSEVGPRIAAWAVTRGEELMARWDAAPSASITRKMLSDLENYAAGLEAVVETDPDLALRISDVMHGTMASGQTDLLPRRFALDPDLLERLWNAAKVSPEVERRALCRRFGLLRDPWDEGLAARDFARMAELGGLEHIILALQSTLAEHRCAHDEAWDYALKCVEASRGKSSEERFRCIVMLTVLAVYRDRGTPEAVQPYIDELLRLAPALPRRHAEAYRWLSDFEKLRGNIPAALQARAESLRIGRAQGLLVASSHGGMADLYLDLGRLEEAERTAREEQSRLEMYGHSYYVILNLMLLGVIYCAQHRDDLARQCWTECATMTHAEPGWVFPSAMHLLVLDYIQGAGSEARLTELGQQPQIALPILTRLQAVLQAFIAVSTGDPERAAQALSEHTRGSVWGSHKAWQALAPALIDLARARNLQMLERHAEAVVHLDAAREKFGASPAGGYEVVLLRRLVERALQDLEPT
jgi:predicted ATPase/class 3 adenylate cyclase